MAKLVHSIWTHSSRCDTKIIETTWNYHLNIYNNTTDSMTITILDLHSNSIQHMGGSKNPSTQNNQWVFLLKMISTWGVKWGVFPPFKETPIFLCSFCRLVGGFNPPEKYARQIRSSSPGIRGENKKYLSCHHLVGFNANSVLFSPHATSLTVSLLPKIGVLAFKTHRSGGSRANCTWAKRVHLKGEMQRFHKTPTNATVFFEGLMFDQF